MTDPTPIYVDLPDIDDGVEIIVRRTGDREVIVRRVGDFSLMMGETPPGVRIRDIETDPPPDPPSPTGSKASTFGLTIMVPDGDRTLGVFLHDDVTGTWHRDSLVLDLRMFSHQAQELRDKLNGLLAEIERPRSTD